MFINNILDDDEFDVERMNDYLHWKSYVVFPQVQEFSGCTQVPDTVPGDIQTSARPEKILHLIPGNAICFGTFDAESPAPHVEAKPSPRSAEESELIKKVEMGIRIPVRHKLSCRF